MIEAGRWGVSVLLLAIATLALVANWSLVLAVIVTKRSGVSMLPVVGGVFGMLGLVVLPVKGSAAWAWAPLVLDPSGIPAIVVALVQDARLWRTAVERLAKLPCPRCGTVIGTEVAGWAKAEWTERTRQAHEHAREHNLKIRLSSFWTLHCSSCAAPLVFSPSGVGLHVDEHRPVSADSIEPRPPGS